MHHLRQLGNQFSISIPPDEKGYVGRECPECEKYFKITFGTGIIGGAPICYCPYCGHRSTQDQFITPAQIEYAKSVVINQVTGAFIKDLKSLEFKHRPRGAFGIGISMKVEGRPEPVRHYSELELEEEVVCDTCTLRYTIYGSFAFCPDCGRHNSRQILDRNLALAQQQVELASRVESDLAAHLTSDALENVVSAFDGFGRETCRVHAAKATDATKAESISFQNLAGAQRNVSQLFRIDLTSALNESEWSLACRCFQKRHLLAHKMGIVDDAYMKATSDPTAAVGRKVSIRAEDVVTLLEHVKRLGSYLTAELERLP